MAYVTDQMRERREQREKYRAAVERRLSGNGSMARPVKKKKKDSEDLLNNDVSQSTNYYGGMA